MKKYFTSESVSEGHPDKICDHISDAVLDEFLRQDPNSKVACECFITNNLLVIGGEAHTNASVDIVGIAKNTIEKIGYDGTNGFNPETAVIVCTMHEQSSDIRQGVVKEDEKEQGAGDQGIMFGYATNETDAYMPLSLVLAHETMHILSYLRKHKFHFLNPDAKCQFTIEYDSENKPKRVHTMLLSTQHQMNVSENSLKEVLNEIVETLKTYHDYEKYFDDDTIYLINPTGSFVIGGPEGDTGLTGRKIIVDTYGGAGYHGGGAFSGKDSSKVDRSAAYMARYLAKNIVASDIAKECNIQISYAIGVAKPLSVLVTTKRDNLFNSMLADFIMENFDLRPQAIVERFGLKNPIFEPTATYGHFGRKPYVKDGFKFFAWEELDSVDKFKDFYNRYYINEIQRIVDEVNNKGKDNTNE